MKLHWAVSSLLVILCVSVGCVSTRSIPYETGSRDPKPSDYAIEILESSHLNRPFKVIGVVQANAGKLHSVKDTLEHLRAEARKMGGDALIDLDQGPAQSEAMGPGKRYSFEDRVREIWSAKVIVWTDDDQKTGAQ
jgi:hypothetical protein